MLITDKVFSTLFCQVNFLICCSPFFIKLVLRNSTKRSLKLNDQENEEELKGAIDLYDTSDPDSKQEKEMLKNILTLSDTTVDEIMIHRSNIFSINISNLLDERYERPATYGQEGRKIRLGFKRIY